MGWSIVGLDRLETHSVYPAWLTATMVADASEPWLQDQLMFQTIHHVFIYWNVQYIYYCSTALWMTVAWRVGTVFVFAIQMCSVNVPEMPIWSWYSFHLFFTVSNLWFLYLLSHWLLCGIVRMAWYWHLSYSQHCLFIRQSIGDILILWLFSVPPRWHDMQYHILL